MRKIPLSAAHESLGAKFGDLNGWEVPLDYGSPSDEHKIVQAKVGLIDLSYFGKVKVFGEEREMFLNALLTNDILPLKNGASLYSALLDRKGKMLSDMWAIKENDSFILIVEPDMQSKLLDILKERVISEIVEIQDVTDDLGLIGIYGPESGQTLINWSSKVDEPLSGNTDDLKLNNPGTGLTIIKSTRLGCLGYDLLFPRSKGDETWSSLLKLDVKPFGLQSFESIRIDAGVPRYGFDLSENTIPMEANLVNAISYSKGCYVGQEVVARVSHIGQVNKRLAQIKLSYGNHRAGTKIFYEEKEVGSLTSISGNYALGYIRREYAIVDTQIQLKSGNDESDGIVSRII